MAALVRANEASAVELVEEAIERLEAVDPALNLVVTPRFELALDEARRGLPDGPLTGVPVLLKDFLAVTQGVRHTEGSDLLGDWRPDYDSEYVARLRRAGAVIVGIANAPEFALLGTTEPRRHGMTRNPWDLERSAGGSSGASAAAVASAAVPAAHGNDAGGSIRIPASCCGVFGLKPTRGRNSLAPDHGDLGGGIWAEHVLTRTVRDSAAFLDVTSGPVPGDPYFAAPPARPYREQLDDPPGRLRIALSTSSLHGTSVHPDCAAAAQDAAALCAELGHEVEDATPMLAIDELEEAFFELYVAGAARRLNYWAERLGRAVTPDEVEPLTWAIYEAGERLSASRLLAGIEVIQRESRRIAGFFTAYDLWLTPTLAQPPFPLGFFDPPAVDPLTVLERDAEVFPFTWVANVTGQPAASLPLYWNDQGLPIGAHFMARFGDEALLFRLSAQLERARRWETRWPPVSAVGG